MPFRRLRDLDFGVEGVRETVRVANVQEKIRDARRLERELRYSCRTCAALLFGIGAISTTTPPRIGE